MGSIILGETEVGEDSFAGGWGERERRGRENFEGNKEENGTDVMGEELIKS